MGSRTLSLAVEEQLRSLCLKDFPCGHGCWSRSRGSIFEEQSWGYSEQDEGREGAAKEEEEALMEHLTSPLSPWQHEGSWSPQARTLRELSVRTPELLHGNFIFSHFNTLRIVDKGVSIVDDGVLRFSNLRELVLSANKISELQAEYLPCTLQVLELYANQVSSLKGLSSQPLPCLQHLGLGCNRLGSPADIQYLTGTLWPQLVSLDLSWSGFQGQRALVDALVTLPCLRTLVLEGNPLTFTPSYPGFILDSLPRLLYLDATRVTPDDHHRFEGLAKMRDWIVDQAMATVTVRRIRGVPDPLLTVDESAPEFPVVSYSYFVNYEFLSQPPPGNKQAGSDTASTSDPMTPMAEKMDRGIVGIYETPKENCEEETTNTPMPDTTARTMESLETNHCSIDVIMNSTHKLAWAESMDYDHTSVHSVGDLGSFKSFVLRGLWLTVEEEKVLSWPAPSGEQPITKSTTEKKGGKECARPPSNTCSNQKSKDKKKKKDSIMDLVQDTPIRRTLGSIHVPLQDLVSGDQRVDALCNLGVLLTEQSTRAMPPRDKDPSKKAKHDKKKEDKTTKSSADSAGGQKNVAPPSKSKGKGWKESQADFRMDDNSAPSPNQFESMTVEFTVHLDKWHSASEAHHLAHP
ncbi:leucine-rich repeat-containing protein 43 isoform X1 [Oncorhynchus mykiss]|uniref:Leucine rich repeat containing 43 n=2 Tax=Oncorhynchus mykiss TaxID=8022 RepID=A0A8K9X7T6_ONCMY|nr:leucine-rich repeat-containing protein 43 isoform X1 [Oncorhynchus mykiss]